MPPERHIDAAKFLKGLSRKGTKLIFGAAQRGQEGTGHIGGRSVPEWEEILKVVGFYKDPEATYKAQHKMEELNHKQNTQVYIYSG
jgi:hypothetical protein